MIDMKDELAELEAMQKEVNNRRQALRDDAKRQAQLIITQFGLHPSDFEWSEQELPRKGCRGPVPPKFRGPNGELWTGRGRTPKWVESLIADGYDIDQFAIK